MNLLTPITIAPNTIAPNTSAATASKTFSAITVSGNGAPDAENAQQSMTESATDAKDALKTNREYRMAQQLYACWQAKFGLPLPFSEKKNPAKPPSAEEAKPDAAGLSGLRPGQPGYIRRRRNESIRMHLRDLVAHINQLGEQGQSFTAADIQRHFGLEGTYQCGKPISRAKRYFEKQRIGTIVTEPIADRRVGRSFVRYTLVYRR